MIERELIFVYNAKSGKINSALDTLHKVFSPKTYACQLCSLTYGNIRMDRSWKQFIASSRIPFRFLHKDEWEIETGRKDDLPAVFERIGMELKIILPAEKLNTLTLSTLKLEIERIIN